MIKLSDVPVLVDANLLKELFDKERAADVEMFGAEIPECFPAERAKQLVDICIAAKSVAIPCNIGDPVYIIVKLKGGAPGHIMKKTCTGIHITEKVFGGRAERANYYLVVNSSIGTAQHIPFTQFGKIVFFDEAEAKAAFEKMRREHDGS